MIVMIDNYDSFTYNLVQYIGELGEEVHVVRNDKVTLPQVEAMDPEMIMISPGPCTPNEAGISLDIIRHFAGHRPVFGVCLGHQAIAQSFGGRIVQAERLMHGKTSEIYHDQKTIFQELPAPFTATRYHSLLVDKERIPACLEVSAWTEQGEIMGLRHREYALEGVQFHPESIMTDHGKPLLHRFIHHYRSAAAEGVR